MEDDPTGYEYHKVKEWRTLEILVNRVLKDRSILEQEPEDVVIARAVAAWLHKRVTAILDEERRDAERRDIRE